jgi:hypothetical protein
MWPYQTKAPNYHVTRHVSINGAWQTESCDEYGGIDMTKANGHRRRTSMTVNIWSWIAIPSVTKIDNSSLIT